MMVEFSLVELNRIRKSIASEVDIIEDELDDERNQQDLDVSRTALLKDEDLLTDILLKLHRAIERITTGTRSRSAARRLQTHVR